MWQYKKCVMVGDSGVGKTSLLRGYIHTDFHHEYLPTTASISETLAMELQQEAILLKLCWVDTPGAVEYDPLRPQSYGDDVDVIILCFALDNPSSFENVKTKWYPEVRHYLPWTPIILAGLKEDLLPRDKKGRTISGDKIGNKEMQALQKELGAVSSCLVSTLTCQGLTSVFETIGRITCTDDAKSEPKLCRAEQDEETREARESRRGPKMWQRLCKLCGRRDPPPVETSWKKKNSCIN